MVCDSTSTRTRRPRITRTSTRRLSDDFWCRGFGKTAEMDWKSLDRMRPLRSYVPAALTTSTSSPMAPRGAASWNGRWTSICWAMCLIRELVCLRRHCAVLTPGNARPAIGTRSCSAAPSPIHPPATENLPERRGCCHRACQPIAPLFDATRKIPWIVTVPPTDIMRRFGRVGFPSHLVVKCRVLVLRGNA